MATTIKAEGVQYGVYTSTTRPTGSAGLVIYNSDRKGLELYNGSEWVAITNKDAPYLYRQIIAFGYVYGGYKSSTPWRNVNKMNHSTDVIANLGDLLQTTHAYTSGFCTRDKAFCWHGSGMGSGSYTSSFNMRNDTTNTHQSSHNNLTSRNDSYTAWQEEYYGYVLCGGTTAVEQFAGATESFTTVSGVTTAAAGGTQASCVGVTDEDKSIIMSGDNSNTQTLVHSTLTSISIRALSSGSSNQLASNAQQKGISSKIGYGWAGNEGTYQGGYNYRKWSFATEDQLSTHARAAQNVGEENFDMGQAHQYMHGSYDGAQNNRCQKWFYYTDSGVELGAGSQRIGVPGGSSGWGSWRDA